MKHYVILLLLVTITACTGVPPMSQPASPSVFSTPRATQTPLITATIPVLPTITKTLQPTITSTLTPRSTTTYDPNTAQTITPPSPGACPTINSNYQPVFADQTVDGWWQNHDLSGPILDALNQGASLYSLKRAVTRATYDEKPAGIPSEAIYAADVTGDGVPEIVFNHHWVIIYTCKDYQYHEIVKWWSSPTNFVEMKFIGDMNLDGLAEIVLLFRFSAGYVNEHYFPILQWNGSEFIDLLKRDDIDIDGIAEWSIRDIDENQTLELVIRNWPPISPDSMEHGPWRHETWIFTWNGNSFVLLSQILDPPEYTFQAVQDGDRAMRRRDYVEAVRFFQQAIQDSNLIGWGYSIAHFFQRREADNAFALGTPTPTALPLDSSEIPTLRAYARFRSLLAYTIMHEDELAESEYQALQNEFSAGNPGFGYTQLGKYFWEGYQKEGQVSTGCQKVLEFAEENQDMVLEPLNRYTDGFQNLSYELTDLCPLD